MVQSEAFWGCAGCCSTLLALIGITLVLVRMLDVPAQEWSIALKDTTSYGREHTGKHWVSHGKGISEDKDIAKAQASLLVQDGQRYKVRCCSDVFNSGWMAPRDTCSVYHESSQEKGEGKKAWGCSGGDVEGLSWPDAAHFCAMVTPFFGRLCTQAELEVGCGKGDGCGYDTHYIWSCTGEHGDCGVSTAGVCTTVDCESCYNEGDTLISYSKQLGGDGPFFLQAMEGLGALLSQNEDLATRHVARLLIDSNATGFGQTIREHCCTKAQSCRAHASLKNSGFACTALGVLCWLVSMWVMIFMLPHFRDNAHARTYPAG
jgi:hypothetical protein